MFCLKNLACKGLKHWEVWQDFNYELFTCMWNESLVVEVSVYFPWSLPGGLCDGKHDGRLFYFIFFFFKLCELYFYPRPLLASGYCCCLRLSVCASVGHQVCPLISSTHQQFKLRSPNSEQSCKWPWLRSLAFCGAMDLDLQGEI